MGPIPQGGTVAVTGSAGFIGGLDRAATLGPKATACVPAFEMLMIEQKLAFSETCRAILAED